MEQLRGGEGCLLPLSGLPCRMKSGGLTAFAQAREEIWLWPSAAMAYYYTLNNSTRVMVAFFVSVVGGAMTYKLHERLRKIVEEERSIASVRRRVTRDGRDSSGFPLEAMVDLFISLAPHHSFLKIVVLIGMLTNMGMFVLLFLWLFGQIQSPASPSVAAMSLFSLPLLMLATTTASIIWNM